MGFEEVRRRIVDNRLAIRKYGVNKIGFFGSVVRGQQISPHIMPYIQKEIRYESL